ELFGLVRLFGHGVDRRLGGSGRVGWGVGGGGGVGFRFGRSRLAAGAPDADDGPARGPGEHKALFDAAHGLLSLFPRGVSHAAARPCWAPGQDVGIRSWWSYDMLAVGFPSPPWTIRTGGGERGRRRRLAP